LGIPAGILVYGIILGGAVSILKKTHAQLKGKENSRFVFAAAEPGIASEPRLLGSQVQRSNPA
jgi:hypothetical protein